MFLKALTFSAALALGALPALAQDSAIFSSKNRIALEQEAAKVMVSMLEASRKTVLDETSPIVVLRYICPHAMEVLAAMTAGALDPRDGARAFAAALVQDRADMVQQSLTGNPGYSLMGADVTLQVKIGEGVSRDELAGLMDLGTEFLSN